LLTRHGPSINDLLERHYVAKNLPAQLSTATTVNQQSMPDHPCHWQPCNLSRIQRTHHIETSSPEEEGGRHHHADDNTSAPHERLEAGTHQHFSQKTGGRERSRESNTMVSTIIESSEAYDGLGEEITIRRSKKSELEHRSQETQTPCTRT
jgi:hypothetical protein